MKDKTLSDEALDELLYEYMPKANIILDQLEEERDKDIVPHVFSEQYNKKMGKLIKEYSGSSVQKKFATFRKFVAGFVILFILTNGILFATAEGYREKFFKIITTIYEKYTSIKIEVEGPAIEGLSFTEPSYIPDGFEIIKDRQGDISRVIQYMNDDRIIVFNQGILTNAEIQIDTEGAIIEDMEVNGQLITYVFNKDMYIAYWTDNEFSYIINAEVSYEEFVRVVEGVTKNKN